MFSTKATISLAAIAVTAVALAGCSTGGSSEKGGDAKVPSEITIGYSTPLTGNSAFGGANAAPGIDLALEDLKKLIPETTIKVEQYDDASDANQGVTAVQHFASDPSIPVIVGGVTSQVAAAAVPVAQRSGIPYVIVNSFTPGLTDAGDEIFQISAPTADYNINEALQAAKAHDLKTVSIIYAQDVPTTVGFRDDFLAGFKKAGVEVVADEAASVNDADFTTVIRNAMAPKPDAVVLLFIGPIDGTITKQMLELGYDPIRLGHVGDVSQGYIDNAGGHGPGVIVNTGFFDGADLPVVQDFTKRVVAKTGNGVPGTQTPNAYAAMMVVGHAIRNLIDSGQEINRDTIKKAMLELGEMPSVLGSTGTAKFGGDTGRVLIYDGFLLTLTDDAKWVEWKP